MRYPLASKHVEIIHTETSLTYLENLIMSRNDFKSNIETPIADILLDTRNPRIRDGSDQADCIARILRKEDQLKALMKDIAEHGLTTMPILVKPKDDKWVVMDGNRRITSLKLLNDPSLCPIESLKHFIESLRDRYKDNITKTVDVLYSTNDDAIAREVLARHSGAQGGVGQLNWNAYMRTVFQINNGHPVDYKRPGQYALWAEKNGIIVDEDFPITSLQRFFTTENLEKLGFKVDSASDNLALALPEHLVKRMAQIVLSDFSGNIKVDDVRTTEKAEEYINSVRARVGLTEDSNQPEAKHPDRGGNEATPPAPNPMPPGNNTEGTGKNPNQPNTPPQPAASNPSPPSPYRPQTPLTPAWERKRLLGSRAPQIPIPTTEKKALNILVEIRNLDVKKNPIAVAMLLRGFIEISDKFYREKHGISDANRLAKNVTASANHMHTNGALTASELDIVTRFSGVANLQDSLLHIEALQKIMHRETHHPNYQLVNTLWDNIAPFVRACWRS